MTTYLDGIRGWPSSEAHGRSGLALWYFTPHAPVCACTLCAAILRLRSVLKIHFGLTFLSFTRRERKPIKKKKNKKIETRVFAGARVFLSLAGGGPPPKNFRLSATPQISLDQQLLDATSTPLLHQILISFALALNSFMHCRILEFCQMRYKRTLFL